MCKTSQTQENGKAGVMTQLSNALGSFQKIVLGGAFGRKALEQRNDWLAEGSIARGEERLSRAKGGVSVSAISDSVRKMSQDLFGS